MKKLYFKFREIFLLNHLLHFIPNKLKPFVLCYHQIDSVEFRAQMEFLRSKYEIVDLQTFLKRIEMKNFGSYCAISVDDCITEDIDKVVPICKGLNIPLTLFLPVGYSVRHEALPLSWIQKLVERKSEFLLNNESVNTSKLPIKLVKEKLNAYFDLTSMKVKDLDYAVRKLFKLNNFQFDDVLEEKHKVMPINEVATLSKDPLFNFQSHTYNHESLVLCSESEIVSEFDSSRIELEKVTGKDVFAICYPFGSKELIGNKISNIVSSYYKCGLTLIQGVCTKQTDKFFIPRIGIYPGDDLTSFKGKIYHYTTLAFFK